MIPDRTKAEFLRGNIDLTAATIRVALMKDTVEYTPDSAAHEFVSDILDGAVAAEYDDTNYSRQPLNGPTVTEDNVDSEGVFDANDVVFSSLGSSVDGQVVQGAVIYIQSGADDSTPGDDTVLRVIDDTDSTNLPKQTNGEDFTLSWDAEGIAKLTG